MKLKMEGLKGFIIAFVIAGLVAALVLWASFERLNAIRNMKIEFQRLQASMIEAGYDLSYSDLKFNMFSLSGGMVIKDFRINNLNAGAYAEFYSEEFRATPDLFHIGKINVGLKGEQRLTWNGKAHPVQAVDLTMSFGLSEDNRLSAVDIKGRNIEIKEMARIGAFKIIGRHMPATQGAYNAAFFEDNIELNNLEVTTPTPWPVSKKFDRVALTFNLVGAMTPQASYKSSLIDWLHQGGTMDIPTIVVNWDAFSLVGKGDVYFDGNLEPKLRLNTSSKGLLEVLEALNNADLLDNKGVFVARILLSNKAFKLNDDDKYTTITSPMDIDKKGFNMEGVTIKYW